MQPTVATEAVKSLKGDTSRVIRKECPEPEEFLWCYNFWADDYLAETVGTVNDDVIRQHVRQQPS
jgi:REP element-mobilizing transposase RayT